MVAGAISLKRTKNLFSLRIEPLMVTTYKEGATEKLALRED
jgi:hypothetical protein